jgi:hypothetical protein
LTQLNRCRRNLNGDFQFVSAIFSKFFNSKEFRDCWKLGLRCLGRLSWSSFIPELPLSCLATFCFEYPVDGFGIFVLYSHFGSCFDDRPVVFGNQVYELASVLVRNKVIPSLLRFCSRLFFSLWVMLIHTCSFWHQTAGFLEIGQNYKLIIAEIWA